MHRVQHTPSTAYPEYSIPRVQHTPSTAYTEYSIHRVQHTPSTAYTEYSIHQVQHTPSTAYTMYSIHPRLFVSIHSDDYELTPQCSFSFQHASLHDWLPSVSSPCELKGKVTLSHSHICKSANWWIESQCLACRPSTASKCSSNFAWSWPPKCISKLARLPPPSASPNSLDRGLQVYLQTCSITAGKFARSWPPSASPNPLGHALGVYLCAHSIVIFRHTSNCSQALPAASPDILYVDR